MPRPRPMPSSKLQRMLHNPNIRRIYHGPLGTDDRRVLQRHSSWEKDKEGRKTVYLRRTG